MNLNALHERLNKAEDEVKRRQGVEPDAAREAQRQRMVTVAELGAAACLVVACGHDIKATAAGLVRRLRAFPEAEWPALFDEARAGIRRISSEIDTAPRLSALEALIAKIRHGLTALERQNGASN